MQHANHNKQADELLGKSSCISYKMLSIVITFTQNNTWERRQDSKLAAGVHCLYSQTSQVILFRGMTWWTLPFGNIYKIILVRQHVYVLSDEDNLLTLVALLAGKNKNLNIFSSSSVTRISLSYFVPFWAIPRRLSSNFRRFGTHYRFHLHRQVNEVYFILHSPAYEDGTDSEFRNVGNQNSDAGELPKKEQISFRTRRTLKNKKFFHT